MWVHMSLVAAVCVSTVEGFLLTSPKAVPSEAAHRLRADAPCVRREEPGWRSLRKCEAGSVACRKVVLDEADVALQEWADRMGIERAAEIARFGAYGRGLVSTRDLAPGEAAVRVPLELALSDQRTPLGVHPAVDNLHYSARLAAALSHEMSLGSNSRLREYISALPPPPRTVHKWDAEVQRLLGNNTLEAEADGMYFWRYNCWDAVQDALPQLKVTEEVQYIYIHIYSYREGW